MTRPPGRIIFAGSPAFAVPGLRALLASDHEVIAVLTQPDRPAGRGRRMRSGPVKDLAVAQGIEVLQPATLKSAAIQDQLRELAPDLIVVIAFGQLFPASVLALPARACVNVHASLLPRWRGASPIQSAIVAGDARTGISLMRMAESLDTGPVYATAITPIGVSETAGELHDRLAELGAELLSEHLDALLNNEIQAQEQAEDGITYAGRIAKADAQIDWSQSAAAIDRQVRAYNPWPVAETRWQGSRLRVWSTRPDEKTGSQDLPGSVLAVASQGLRVATGDGCLWLTEVQLAGRQRLPAEEFARGHAVVGERLGS